MDAKKPTVEELLKKNRSLAGGDHSLYLLTTTAEQFFLRRGYSRKTL